MIDKILDYRPLTREGLKLQCRALIFSDSCDWDPSVASFVASFLLYFGVKNPDPLMVKLLDRASPYCEDDDEDKA